MATKQAEKVTVSLPVEGGEGCRDFRGRLADGMARGIVCPIVSEGALKFRGSLMAQLDGARYSIYDIAADEWVEFHGISRRKGNPNDADTARVFPKGRNADSNSAATSLRRYFKVFGDAPEGFRIVTLNDDDPIVTFVVVA